jgi:outer membrane protein
MKNTMNHKNTRSSLLALAVVLAFGAAGSAHAQSAGTWSVAAGINDIKPQGTTSPLTAPSIPNSTTKVSSDAQPLVDITYMITDNFAVEFGIGTPYKHNLSGAGALQGSGQLGTLKQLPPTVFGQYHFLPADAPLRPYVGLGITYAMFYDEQGSGTLTALSNTGQTPATFTVDNKWGYVPEVGLQYAFNKKWFVDAMFGKTYINTTVHLNPGGQTAGARLNPEVGSIVIGYRF